MSRGERLKFGDGRVHDVLLDLGVRGLRQVSLSKRKSKTIFRTKDERCSLWLKSPELTFTNPWFVDRKIQIKERNFTVKLPQKVLLLSL